MSKLYLFTTPTCGKCPAAKELVKEHNIDCELIDASTPKGIRQAQAFNIMQVPTFLEQFDDGSYTIHANAVIINQRKRFQKEENENK